MRFANLQALRFVAALATLLPHLGYYASHVLGVRGPVVEFLANSLFGLGMTTFFALSGFVVAHSLRTTSPGAFLGWRLARLYLPYWAACGIAFVTWQALGYAPGHIEYRQLWRGLILLPVGPYRAGFLLFVEWTLIYELYFSIVVAGLALAGRRGVVLGSLVWLAAVVIAVGTRADGSMTPQPSLTQMGLCAPIAPILMGVLAYEAFLLAPRAVRMGGPLAFIAFVVIGRTLPRWDYVVIANGVAAAILCAWCAAAQQLHDDSTLVRYGDWSYGIYLVHVPAMVAAFAIGSRTGWLPVTENGIAMAGAFALAVGLAYGKLEVAGYRWLRRWAARPAVRVGRVSATFARAA